MIFNFTVPETDMIAIALQSLARDANNLVQNIVAQANGSENKPPEEIPGQAAPVTQELFPETAPLPPLEN